MIGNEIYALPFSPSVQLLYYRKDLFESNVLRRVYQERFRCELLPPETFEQFNHIAAFFTRQLNPQSPVPYGASLTLGSIGVAGSEFMARYLEKHQNLYTADGRVRLNDAAGQDAMRQLVELRSYVRYPVQTGGRIPPAALPPVSLRWRSCTATMPPIF